MSEIAIKSVKMTMLSNAKYKDRIFRLLWIRDIHTKSGENYYKVLFRDINKKSSIYLEEEIFPEFFHDQYAIGLHYKNGSLSDTLPPTGKIMQVTVTSTENNRILRIDEVLSDKEYNLNHSSLTEKDPEDFTKSNKRQFCVVFENEKQIIIFPCAVIGARYYFTSSSMRKHLFAMRLDSLYEEIELNTMERSARILLKHGAASDDAPYIIRFAENEFAKKKWRAVHNSLVETMRKTNVEGEKPDLAPLQLDIPLQQTIQMNVRGYIFKDFAKGKDKILVFEILTEDSQFDFDTVIIQRRVKGKLQGDKTVIETKRFKTSEVIKNKYPSSRYKTVPIKPINRSTNPNLDAIKVVKEYLREEDESGSGETVPVTQDIEPAIGISVMEPAADGDKDTRPVVVRQQEEFVKVEPKERKTREYFVLADFMEMMLHLRQQEEVIDMNISKREYVPPKYKSRNRKSLTYKESYDKTLGNRRAFARVNFKYKEKSVCLVEIDHDRLINGPGTYVMTTDGLASNLDTCVENIATAFVKSEKYKKTKEEMKKIGIFFGSKKHPASKKYATYQRWCFDLLRKIAKQITVNEQ